MENNEESNKPKRYTLITNSEHHKLLRKEAYENDTNITRILAHIIDEYFARHE